MTIKEKYLRLREIQRDYGIPKHLSQAFNIALKFAENIILNLVDELPEEELKSFDESLTLLLNAFEKAIDQTEN